MDAAHILWLLEILVSQLQHDNISGALQTFGDLVYDAPTSKNELKAVSDVLKSQIEYLTQEPKSDTISS